ncbi:hypothetical protein GGR58DRAFT_216585 [Xylaria digitata]|nr:hypothetical protein GGR58DRAFT_216585 [Xylaria digitata]
MQPLHSLLLEAATWLGSHPPLQHTNVEVIIARQPSLPAILGPTFLAVQSSVSIGLGAQTTHGSLAELLRLDRKVSTRYIPLSFCTTDVATICSILVHMLSPIFVGRINTKALHCLACFVECSINAQYITARDEVAHSQVPYSRISPNCRCHLHRSSVQQQGEASNHYVYAHPITKVHYGDRFEHVTPNHGSRHVSPSLVQRVTAITTVTKKKSHPPIDTKGRML